MNNINTNSINIVEVIFRWVAENPEEREPILKELESIIIKMAKEIEVKKITSLPIYEKKDWLMIV